MNHLHRRDFLRSAALALAATPFIATNSVHAQFASDASSSKGLLMTSSSSAAPQGPGSASGAPNLPDGFANTFTSQLVDAGEIRQHAVVGGDGPPLLLIHGWPQTWYAWRMVMPTLARDFTVIAVDQRGRGLSDKPRTGYDSTTVANDMVALMDALGYQRFAVYGTDVGMPIAYALAADHAERVERLVVSEAPLPGISPTPAWIPAAVNERLWHINFNRAATVNEQLVKGREDIYFGNEFDVSAARKLPDYAVKYYVDQLAADPEALRGSFEFYRALDETVAQNQQRVSQRLTLPVLAIGGEKSSGEGVGATMRFAADDVQSVILAGSGHWVAEEAPDDLLAALSPFLAPYHAAAAGSADSLTAVR
jgi:pimeloyl-ACP methyl ester carboxylesterase